MNILRPLLLSILILTLLAAGLPLSITLAHWGHRASVSGSKGGKHLRRRHSRAWWRRRRARLQRQRTLAQARRRRRRGNNFVISALNTRPRLPVSAGVTPARASGRTMAAVPTSRLPFDIQLPHTWSRTGAKAPGEMRFVVNGADGRAAGSVVIAPVASGAAGDSFSASRRKSLGGVSLATLGRTVIDRMIAEGGWVMNDFVRQMEGRRVYVVLAQSGTPGAPSQSWTFYFTEVDGRIYSLAANAPLALAAPLAADSESVLASLRLHNATAAMSAQALR